MEEPGDVQKSYAEMLSRCLVEVADLNGQMLTVLDLLSTIVARLDERDHDEVVNEINEMLKERRRQAIGDIEAWATGSRSNFDD